MSFNNNRVITNASLISLTICLIALLFSSCGTSTESEINILKVKAYRLESDGPEYFILRINEDNYCFSDIIYSENVDSICNNMGIGIDSIICFNIDKCNSFFDTIFYANFCYERTIIDRLNICLTRGECFIHSCSTVGQINVKFKLDNNEARLLDFLISECDLMNICRKSKTTFSDEDYSVNYRIRLVRQNSYCDILLSDTHQKFKEFALLNSFILGISNKYIRESNESEEPYFLIPIW